MCRGLIVRQYGRFGLRFYKGQLIVRRIALSMVACRARSLLGEGSLLVSKSNVGQSNANAKRDKNHSKHPP